MVPLIGILLCVYLVFKGYEIFQIALCGSGESKTLALVMGAIFFVAGIIVAAFFAYLFLSSGAAIPAPPPR